MKKAKLVKQRDSSDCGAACLASVAAHFGLRIPLSRVRQYAGTNAEGTSLYGLIEAARSLHFLAKGVKAGHIPLSAIPVPSIYHLILENDVHHFVVVYKLKKKSVVIMDPAAGKMNRETLTKFKTSWSGIVLLLIPSDNFERLDECKPVISRFKMLIRPHRCVLLQALLGALVYTLLGLSTSIYIQKIVDLVLPDANRNLMNLLGSVMILLLCFQIITGYLKSLIVIRTGQQIDARLILGYFKHLMELPQRFFDQMRVGEIISRINDAVRIRVFINDVVLGLIVHLLTIVLSLTAMFIYYWKLALLMIMTIPVYLMIYWIGNRVNAKWQRRMMETGAALENQLVESVQAVSTIRRFGQQDYFNMKTETRFIPLMRSIYTGNVAGLKITHATEWLTGCLTIIILWKGSYLVIDQQLSPGQLLSFYTLTAFFTTPVQAIMSANKSMQDALIAADRLFEIIDLETETGGEVPSVQQFPEGDLTFSNVNFSYGPGNNVFNGLDLRICQFGMTAIAGESGCGKSTLLSLIQRVYPVSQGNILIGNTDIQYLS